jgi:hypothetical protein
MQGGKSRRIPSERVAGVQGKKNIRSIIVAESAAAVHRTHTVPSPKDVRSLRKVSCGAHRLWAALWSR